ncbi:MAG TPA: RodZ domain-containing protein [Candidatus Cybelea sp.]|jgi:cytoskeletal protein RodZ|nr:RodZ domain-containing protein [Candidatus Cybelea sp.]
MSEAGPQNLGERFRAAREARGLALSDAAEHVRIRSLYLAAIEDENWKTIGAPVYIRGFLRTYARFLGLDPEEAVATFNLTQPDLPASSSAASGGALDPSRSAHPWRSSLVLWIAGTIAVVLVAFVVYNALTMNRQAVVAEATASPSAVPALSTAPAAPRVAATPATGPGGANSLAVVFSAPSWMRVTVDGNVSMEGTFPAGTSKTFHGKTALVRIGNAGGVEIYVDGKDRGKLGKSGDVVEQAFTL